jgi:hypothetical protein
VKTVHRHVEEEMIDFLNTINGLAADSEMALLMP